jgi:diacylglycerol kinase (ATP)
MSTRPAPTACVIYNPEAGSAERIEELRQHIEPGDRIDLWASEAEGDVSRLARRAADERVRVVIAAGGDGTIREVASGLMGTRGRRARAAALPDLLILPMGTGNDLVRTLELPEAPQDVLALLHHGRRRPLDVLRWSLKEATRRTPKTGWCVNVIAGGFAAKLKRALTPEVKKFWGPLAYARAAFSSMDEVENPHTLTYSVDGGEPQTIEAINVIIANARYAGGGMEVAPQADPSDGQMELVVITPGGLLDLAEVTARLLMGEVDQSQHTLTATARTLRLSADPPIPFNIDGDPAGAGTLEVRVMPAALHVLVPEHAAPPTIEPGSRMATSAPPVAPPAAG